MSQRPPAWALAALLAAVYLVAEPPTADHAAQLYRADLFSREGFALWDNGWYSGHHVPAYSVLFPPLGWVLGPRLAGALAMVAATAIVERMAPRRAALAFAIVSVTPLLSGRLTFALGVAIGLGAVLAWERGRGRLGVALAVGCALASPVAGAFLALAAVVDRRWATAVAALAPGVALSVLFPEGGEFPFEADAFWPPLAATLVLVALLPAGRLRTGTLLYGAALVASFVLVTPMGGNASRLGALLALPVAVAALAPRRAALLAPALLYWAFAAPVDDIVRSLPDDSTKASYYDGLVGFLRTQDGEPLRVEVPFTDNHWESFHLGRHVPLARGWERQLDRHVNELFYDEEPLTQERYLGWLRANAVRFVALADAPLDPSSGEEAALVRRMPVVWRDAHWRVVAVPDPAPLADGARTIALAPQHVDLAATRRDVFVRVRWSPYWWIDGGCVEKAGDYVRLRLRRAGPVRLRMRFSLRRVGATSARCSG